MKSLLTVVQIFTALIVSGLILLQAKGTGLGRTFGQASYHSKRGVEYVIFRFTIFTAILFVLVSVANQILT
jgi:protein translocase SecG subunit